jgi:hypothetical protein
MKCGHARDTRAAFSSRCSCRRVAPIPPVIHYAPIENLEQADVALFDRAEREIDMAAYVLTDWPVMQAAHARRRSWCPNSHLYGTQLAERPPAKVFNDLAETPGVEIRIKHETSAPMHLKELSNRRAFLAHRRRELFRIRAQAAG